MENRTTNVKVGIVAVSATVLLTASLYYFRDNIRNTFSFSQVTTEVSFEENNTKNDTDDSNNTNTNDTDDSNNTNTNDTDDSNNTNTNDNNKTNNEGIKYVLGLTTIKEKIENNKDKKITNKKDE
jgi:hypothetical protein